MGDHPYATRARLHAREHRPENHPRPVNLRVAGTDAGGDGRDGHPDGGEIWDCLTAAQVVAGAPPPDPQDTGQAGTDEDDGRGGGARGALWGVRLEPCEEFRAAQWWTVRAADYTPERGMAVGGHPGFQLLSVEAAARCLDLSGSDRTSLDLWECGDAQQNQVFTWGPDRSLRNILPPPARAPSPPSDVLELCVSEDAAGAWLTARGCSERGRLALDITLAITKWNAIPDGAHELNGTLWQPAPHPTHTPEELDRMVMAAAAVAQRPTADVSMAGKIRRSVVEAESRLEETAEFVEVEARQVNTWLHAHVAAAFMMVCGMSAALYWARRLNARRRDKDR